MYLGDFLPGQPVRLPFSTNTKTGSSVGRSVQGTIQVYKGTSTVESTTGVTDSPDFDAVTGVHFENLLTDGAFYVAHEDYTVVLQGAVIDGESVNAVLGTFSVLNRGAMALVTPGTVSTVISSSHFRCSDITLASNVFRHREVWAGYGATAPWRGVIAAHSNVGGIGDFTLLSDVPVSLPIGTRILIA